MNSEINIEKNVKINSLNPITSTNINNSITHTHKYSGLSNQGSTCYLNSLLQSLFMTPEFRFNLFNWKFNQIYHGTKQDSIPYQLQKLFARLEMKFRNVEETIDLTKSFQWSHSEVFHQHDIQELCRILFEAIENSMSPDEHNFINELYEGESCSIVECQDCHKMSEKFDKFLDVTLPIRNDFDKIYNKSLGMALCNYLKPELLCKENKYFCEDCNKKVDALKYVKFTKLPKILTLSFSRFEYDFIRDMRKKINDKVNFPLILNFNKYMKKFSDIKYDPNFEEIDDECLFLNNTENYNKYIEESIKEGPLVYELYSIVIHSGTATGGHYYAYIKSFEDGSWYNFNDSNVSQLKTEDLKYIFGGNVNANTKLFSSATGYVLMYRQKISIENNQIFIFANSCIDEELRKDIESENLKIKEEQEKLKENLNNKTIKIFFNKIQKTILVKKNETLMSMKLKMMKEFDLKEKYQQDDVRIRSFNQNGNKFHEFYHKEDLTIEDNNIMTYKVYSLDFRNTNTNLFEEYDPDLINIQLFNWRDDYENQTENDFVPYIIKFNNKKTLLDLKNLIISLFNYDSIFAPLYIFRKVEISQTNYSLVELFKAGEDLSKELFKCAILDNSKIFIEVKTNLINFESKFSNILSLRLCNILVKFNSPVNKKIVSIMDYKLDLEIEVNKNSQMKIVKEKIAEILGIKPKDFKMRKFNHNGSEIKNLEETVLSCISGLIMMITFNIYIELGTPMLEKDLKINLFYCENDYMSFKLFPYKLTEVGNKIVNQNWSILEFKNYLIKEIKENLNIDLDNNEFVIIRESVSDRPSRIFNENLILKDLEFIENKKIIVQEYKKEKLNFTSDQIQVMIRFWDVENWELSEAFEIHLNKNAKLKELYSEISRCFPNIHPENIGVNKIINGFNTYMNDINNYPFHNLFENLEKTINTFPLFLLSPGNLLIVRDLSQSVKEPQEEKFKFYCKPENSIVLVSDKNNNPSSFGSIISDSVKLIQEKFKNGLGKKKETGIVIKVKKNQEEIKKTHEEVNETEKKKEENNIINDNNEIKKEEIKNNHNYQNNNKNIEVIDYRDYEDEEEIIFEPLI